MSEPRPLLTLITEALCEAWTEVPTPEDLKLWFGGLDVTDPVNKQALLMVSHNPGWLDLLAARVERHLDGKTPAA